jgi:hypothetical protein
MINLRLPARFFAFSGMVLLIGALSLRADVVALQPSADTTLFEVAPDNNLGGANFFNAGTTATGFRNRALLLFDLGSVLPAGAVITEATLTLDIVRASREGGAASLFDLRRVLQPWGEGMQVPDVFESPGLGAPAVEGEATWNSRFAPGTAWSLPGGQAGVDFSGQTSASALVQGVGDAVFFESTPGLVSDVQAWLNQPAANFGWMFLTQDEDIERSAHSFASRESGFGPTLTISFTVVPEPSTLALAGVALLCFLGTFRARR